MSKRINLAKFKEKKKSRYKQRSIFYLLIILIIIGGYFFVFQKIYALTIYPRVYCCDNFNLSGLVPRQAEILLDVFVENIESNGFSFRAKTDSGEKQTIIQSNIIALGDPDLSRSLIYFNTMATSEIAYQIGREGSFFQQALKMLSTITKDKKVDLIIDINEQEIENILKESFSDLEKPAQDARIAVLNGELVVLDEKQGFILDYSKAIHQLSQNLKNLKAGEIQISTILQTPQITIQELSAALNQARDLLDSVPYILTYEDKTWDIQVDQVGQWFESKKDSSDKVTLTLNQKKILIYLESISKEINIKQIERKLIIDNGRVVEFQAGKSGLILNTEESAKIIAQSILDKNKKIVLIIDNIIPSQLPEDINSLGIKELIGRGVSNFAGSPKNRRHNIAMGAEKLHGILIKPDEEFSLIQALGDIDKENGFLTELVIKGDRTIPEYGGGLCQVSTTVFRGVINAGFPITERRNHSYRVSYYEPPAGMDATIYSPSPDFKFINDTGHYILLQVMVQGNDLIFELYGTSDGRKVETSVPRIFNITEPGPPKFIETYELKPGEKRRVERAIAGASAEFKNIITFANGIVKEDVWKSYYRPWPEVWLVGKDIEETVNISIKDKSDI